MKGSPLRQPAHGAAKIFTLQGWRLWLLSHEDCFEVLICCSREGLVPCCKHSVDLCGTMINQFFFRS